MSAASPQAVVIGGSAGSLEALFRILPELPADFPLPVLVVVHQPADKQALLTTILQPKCRLRVVEAADTETIRSGAVYVAPSDYHLLVQSDHTVCLDYDEPENFSRPSIDVLFEAAADVYGEGLIGIVLSGANADGARGLARIVEEGGQAVVQAPEEAFARAMPLAALKACPHAACVPSDQIVPLLLKRCHEIN